jgi:flagellar motor switch protein FliN/FliY
MTPHEQIAQFGEVPLDITVELDRRVMSMRDVLGLEEGEILATSRSAGENIDVYVGGVLFAYGEMVVIENKLGVRITDFHSRD